MSLCLRWKLVLFIKARTTLVPTTYLTKLKKIMQVSTLNNETGTSSCRTILISDSYYYDQFTFRNFLTPVLPEVVAEIMYKPGRKLDISSFISFELLMFSPVISNSFLPFIE